MPLDTRPFLAVYVAWHPGYADGRTLAEAIRAHYGRDVMRSVTAGIGLSVVYRSEQAPGSPKPMPVDIEEAETTAVIALVDRHWVEDAEWRAWARELAARFDQAGLRARLFPVFIEKVGLELGVAEQALRWDKWEGLDLETRTQRLFVGLTFAFCRMLRMYLERLKHPNEDDDERLLRYLRAVDVFLSHSKHDCDRHGEQLARLIRDRIHNGEEGMDAFFDVHDIAAGVRFDRTILAKLRTSAVVAIHSDTYSSREWCRREVIEAKRAHVPLVVAHCVSDREERGFPYLGNVPVVRLDPPTQARVELVISRLLDEVLKDFLWRCRVELAADADPEAVFLPRPPELISLASSAVTGRHGATLVYPDPPIGAEEQSLFESVAPGVRLRSINEWIAESGL